ncbi:twin-arginine translocase TatA/TatE family subunit [Streptomyces sp. NPDC056347]|uniref:twin-arginine translocase TatA/TatE family subunit n=1 Tax=Streptomyces sp. NPDC056347 TaxID=3345790 RepID=UPI0035D6501B
MFGISEFAVVLIVVILLLGAKKLPELARSAGKSARILKAEAKAMKEPRAPGAEQRTEQAAEQGAPLIIRGETVARHDATAPVPAPERDQGPSRP